MKFIVIIPSRYQSTRLPGKPLLDIHGKPMIERVWDKAAESGAERVIIATDDVRIQQAVQGFGAEVCMTSSKHQSGTDRLAEVVDICAIDEDAIIVNVQGDEPLIPHQNILQVAKLLDKQTDVHMATLASPINSIEELNDPNAVKTIINEQGAAIYFSRSPIPFDRDKTSELNKTYFSQFLRHIGIYAYRAGFLKQFSQWPVAAIENLEKLEQLRVLAKGYKIQISVAEKIPPTGIDTTEDLERVRAILSKNSDN